MAVNKIIMQDLSNGSDPKVIVSGDFLNFSKLQLITGINTIEDLLFWTDDFNQPRNINTDTATEDPTYYDNEDKISVAKIAPYMAPFVYEHQNLAKATTVNTLLNDANVDSEYLKDKFVRFSYRYKFENDEYSIIAPFTQIVFEPLNNGAMPEDTATTENADRYGTTAAFETGRVTVMENAINRVKLRIPLPTDNEALTVTAKPLLTSYSGASSFDLASSAAISPGTYILKGDTNDSYTNGITQFRTDTTVTPPTTGTAIDLLTGTVTGLTGEKVVFVPMWENNFSIKSVEILVKESNDQAVRVIGEIEVKDTREFEDSVDVYPIQVWSTKPAFWRHCVVFDYKGEKPYKVLPEDQITRVSDNVPRLAKAQEVVSNRVVYGNYLKDYAYPTDGQGKKGINYNVISTSKGGYEYSGGELMHLNLQHSEKAYRHSSIKQRRTYQVGIVLSDRWGRQSPVILSSIKTNGALYDNSDTITITNDVGNASTGFSAYGPGGAFSWSADETDIIGKALAIQFNDNRVVPNSESYNSNSNKFGWYSYRVVVKQTQQEYYNVYVSHPSSITAGSSDKSFISLFGDNINKVPRSILDQDITRGNISGSDALLYPKVIQDGTAAGPFSKMAPTGTLLDIISIGTKSEQDPDNALSLDTFVYRYEKNPLLAEVINLHTYYGTSYQATDTEGLTIFETEPFDSKLDIFYETSTAGLISDLNYSLRYAPSTSQPTSIEFENGTNTVEFAESYSGIVTSDIQATLGSAGHTLFYEILNLWSYHNNNQVNIAGRITLSNINDGADKARITVEPTPAFAHYGDGKDTYDLIVKVNEYNASGVFTGAAVQVLTLGVTNVAPNISLYNASLNVLYFSEPGSIVKEDGDPYTGQVDNGGLSATENGLGLTLSFAFDGINNTTKKEQAEAFFEINQAGVNSYFNIVTTKAYQDSQASGSTFKRADFFLMTDAERTMTITATDAGGLASTVDATVYEKEVGLEMNTLKNMPHYSEFDWDVNTGAVSGYRDSYPGVYGYWPYLTGYLTLGDGSGLDITRPVAGNKLYLKKDLSLPWALTDTYFNWTNDDSFVDLVVVYNYTYLGNSQLGESRYDVMVVSHIDSKVITTASIYVQSGNTAIRTIALWGAITYPLLGVGAGLPLFDLDQL